MFETIMRNNDIEFIINQLFDIRTKTDIVNPQPVRFTLSFGNLILININTNHMLTTAFSQGYCLKTFTTAII